MKLAGPIENRYISACLHFAASDSLNVLKKQFTGNYSRTLSEMFVIALWLVKGYLQLNCVWTVKGFQN